MAKVTLFGQIAGRTLDFFWSFFTFFRPSVRPCVRPQSMPWMMRSFLFEKKRKIKMKKVEMRKCPQFVYRVSDRGVCNTTCGF